MVLGITTLSHCHPKQLPVGGARVAQRASALTMLLLAADLFAR